MVLETWWMFLIFFGGLTGICCCVLCIEKSSDDDDILSLKPAKLLIQVLLNQMGFYAMYAIILFSLDVAFLEPFTASQMFDSHEFNFVDNRGNVCVASLVLAFSSASLVLMGVIQKSSEMLDHCFTVSFIHFIIVVINMKNFPYHGMWWVAWAIGLVGFVSLAEIISHKFEMMPYKSAMGASLPPKKDKNDIQSSPEPLSLPSSPKNDGSGGSVAPTPSSAATSGGSQLHLLGGKPKSSDIELAPIKKFDSVIQISPTTNEHEKSTEKEPTMIETQNTPPGSPTSNRVEIAGLDGKSVSNESRYRGVSANDVVIVVDSEENGQHVEPSVLEMSTIEPQDVRQEHELSSLERSTDDLTLVNDK